MSPHFLGAVGELSPRDLGLLVLLVKATLILVSALAITVAMQRASAGARHLVWLVALGTLLVVPALAVWAPLRLEILPAAANPSSGWSAPVEGRARVAAGSVVVQAPQVGEVTAPAPSAVPDGHPLRTRILAMSVLSLALAAWALVALSILAWLAGSAFVVRRIVREARRLDTEGWSAPLYEIADRLELDEAPRLLRSDEAKMPFACGLFRPTIVLPAESEGWSLDRRRAVLLHELAHVRRRDLAGHTLGRIACAFYWFHPLVWTAARELRAESERACDDLALSCGTSAADYAEHLLDIVTSVRRDATPSVALAMARRKEFEGRMLAILDPHLRRTSPSRAQSTALIASLAVIALVVGAAAPARRVQRQADTSTAATPSRMTPAVASPFEQHSTPGGYAYRKSEQQITNEVTHRVTTQVIDKATDKALARALARGSIGVGEISDPAVRGTIAGLLDGDHGKGARGPDDRPVLLAKVLHTDTSAALRRVAAWGLAEYTSSAVAIDALDDAVVHDRDADVREMAAWALGEADGREATTRALATALKSDASARVRATAAWALGSIGDRAATDPLVAALGDASAEVRKRAVWALGSVEPRQAPPALTRMLADKDPQVRELTAWALYSIADPQSAPALQAAVKTETDKDLQLSYIRSMAAVGEKSVDALRDLLESSDPRVRSMAVHALAGGQAAGPWPWPWPEPRPFP